MPRRRDHEVQGSGEQGPIICEQPAGPEDDPSGHERPQPAWQ
ncbi:hypothetical protein ACFFX0_18175 [Citricoccus parietis]|uniref:Uncharacterized protein n=1 Tax=Citricoccus parietis TaxID=592307 RepID=A0ABV5G257_9MICC